MLARARRLTRGHEFAAVTRGGRRAGRPHVVVHVLSSTVPNELDRGYGSEVRVGLVVSKKVGNAVVRHQVSRRLRHVMMSVIGTLPSGTDVVVRALPPTAHASSADLDADIRSALSRIGARTRSRALGSSA